MAFAGLLALGAELTRRPAQVQHLSPLTIVVLALAFVPMLQFASGLIWFAGDAWLASAYLLSFALAQILGQSLASRLGSAELFDRLGVLFLMSAVLSVGLQFYQWLQLIGLGVYGIELPFGHSPFANLAQPNHLATALFLGLVGLLHLYDRYRVRGWIAAIGSMFLLFGMAMTGSRTAWLEMSMLTIWLAISQRRGVLRLSARSVATLSIMFLLTVLIWEPLNDKLLLSGGRTFANQSEAGPRPLLWRSMLDAASRQPWWGYGWNQGLVAQSRVAIDHPTGGRLFESSHNLMLDLAIWNGVPLCLLLVLVLAYWTWTQIRACKSSVQVYGLLAIGGVFVHSAVEYPLSYMYFLLPTGLIIGMLHAVVPGKAALKISRSVLATLALLLAILFLTISYDYTRIESNIRVLRFEVARIGTGRIESSAPNLLVLTQWGEYLRFARAEARPDMAPGDLDRMARVTERFPYAVSLLTYAEASALNGRRKDAEDALLRLCRLNTPAACRTNMREWRSFVDSRYPQLSNVHLPAEIR